MQPAVQSAFNNNKFHSFISTVVVELARQNQFCLAQQRKAGILEAKGEFRWHFIKMLSNLAPALPKYSLSS